MRLRKLRGNIGKAVSQGSDNPPNVWPGIIDLMDTKYTASLRDGHFNIQDDKFPKRATKSSSCNDNFVQTVSEVQFHVSLPAGKLFQ